MHRRQIFSQCQNLAYHIEHAACQNFDATRPGARVPPASRPHLLEIANGQGPEALLQDATLCEELQRTCAICSQHVEHTRRLSQHVMRCHPDTYRGILPSWQHLQLRLKGFTKPASCPHCRTKINILSQHKCSVLMQVARIGARASRTPDNALTEQDHHSEPTTLQQDARNDGGSVVAPAGEKYWARPRCRLRANGRSRPVASVLTGLSLSRGQSTLRHRDQFGLIAFRISFPRSPWSMIRRGRRETSNLHR